MLASYIQKCLTEVILTVFHCNYESWIEPNIEENGMSYQKVHHPPQET